MILRTRLEGKIKLKSGAKSCEFESINRNYKNFNLSYKNPRIIYNPFKEFHVPCKKGNKLLSNSDFLPNEEYILTNLIVYWVYLNEKGVIIPRHINVSDRQLLRGPS